MSSVNSQPVQNWFATCPKGLESLLAAELSTLGAESVRETIAGVHFGGSRACAYRACLWTRLANRILWPIAQIPAADSDALYDSLLALPWGDYFSASESIAIDFTGDNREIRNTQFGAQRSKDAVVDWFQAKEARRPSVDRSKPDVRINIRLVRETAHVAIDLSGGSLHQRGYRLSTGSAPLKENVAAAMLLRADWPGMAARGGALIDPMCGAATLLLEGAMMAADIAPALGREHFGFTALKTHDAPQWQAIYADAQARAERGRAAQLPEIRGYDADPRVIRRAQENIERLGLSRVVRVSVKPVAELTRPTHKPLPHGLIVCNPPYGERLGTVEELAPTYSQLGRAMAAEFAGWQAAVLTSELELGKAIGLRSHKRYTLYNGAIAVALLLFDLSDNTFREVASVTAAPAPKELSEGARMFANRLQKNQKRLSKWRNREHIECYRLYDADMPEYAVVVDVYGQNAHVAEYRAPKGVSVEAAQRRLDDVRAVLPDVLGIDPQDIAYKQRTQQKGTTQYQKQSSRGELRRVREGEAYFLINLFDYLDTGLFLDHRPLRRALFAESRDKDFLNLFCYTGSATVQAALGGARSTTSVDTSNTYLEWLQKNLAQNGLASDNHAVVRADCQTWLAQATDSYDVILLDPPSFSNSKSRESVFDVQRDHVELVHAAIARLRPDGVLYFSNNRRDFQLDAALASAYTCEDITGRTLDPDFARGRASHHCWRFGHRSG